MIVPLHKPAVAVFSTTGRRDARPTPSRDSATGRAVVPDGPNRTSSFKIQKLPALTSATLRLGRWIWVLTVFAGVIGHLNAQTFTTWNSASSAAYATASNWSNGGPISSKVAQFDTVISTSGVLGISGTSINSQSIVITNNYTGNLTLGASGTTGSNLSYTFAGNAAIDGVSNVAISNNSSKNLTFNPTHTSGNNTLQLTFGNATNNVIRVAGSGNITINAKITGSNPISISANSSETGLVFFTAANTYTGLTTVSTGILRVSNAAALGSNANGTTVSIGAALELSGGITIGAEALTLSGNGVSSGGALRNIAGDNTYQGAITLAADTRINSDSGNLTLDVASGSAITGTYNLSFGGVGNITVADAIATSTGTLTKEGQGTLTLSGANTYTGT
ncbi:MAG: autotransporter-associated beta strand repeat-containing protein, partial [Spartobacteria bacterium]